MNSPMYPSSFDEPLMSHEDYLYEQYRRDHIEECSDEELNMMYEYYSCYEVIV